MSNELEARYAELCGTPSDISEHLPKLRELARQSGGTVVELGFRYGWSTVAFLAGLSDSIPYYFAGVFWGAVVSVDKDDCLDAVRGVAYLAKVSGVPFTFMHGNTLDVTIPACDLLFIDTVHADSHCRKELARHAGKVRRRIAFHDTEIFGERGDDGGPGLKVTIRRFLADYPEWFCCYHARNNHGLTVISRQEGDRPGEPCLL